MKGSVVGLQRLRRDGYNRCRSRRWNCDTHSGNGRCPTRRRSAYKRSGRELTIGRSSGVSRVGGVSAYKQRIRINGTISRDEERKGMKWKEKRKKRKNQGESAMT
jgi:hypothetical protein